MKKAIGLASALAAALVTLSASAAFAATAAAPCGPLWVDKDGNRVKAWQGVSNPNNAPDCALTHDNWSKDIVPNINDSDAQEENYIRNNNQKNAASASHPGSYDPGIGEISANDPHMAQWSKDGEIKTNSQGFAVNSHGGSLSYRDSTGKIVYLRPSAGNPNELSSTAYDAKGNPVGTLSPADMAKLKEQAVLNTSGQMKTVTEKINEDSDRIDTKQDKITADQIAKAQSWVNSQIATAAAGGTTPPSGGSIKPMAHITADDTATPDKTAGSINNVIDGLNNVQGVATGAQLAAKTNAGNIKTNTQGIADNKTAIQTNVQNIGINTKGIAANAAAIASNTASLSGKQDKITDAQIEAAKAWVKQQIPAAPPAGGGDDCKPCDTIKKITDTDADGNITAKDTTARAAAAKAQGTADNAQADATKALTGGANDSTARTAAAAAQTEADQNKGNIAQNRSDIDKNSGLIAETRGSIGDDNFRQVSVQQHLADMNQTVEDTSKADRAYTDQVGQNTLKSANAYTDDRINGLSRKVDHLKSRIDSGVAGATALASIPFSSLTKNSFGGSVASANSKAAGAVGYQRNFGRHWSARGTVAFGDHYTQGGVGGTFNW